MRRSGLATYLGPRKEKEATAVPREEKSYKEFYPDLDVNEPLRIIKTKTREQKSRCKPIEEDQKQRTFCLFEEISLENKKEQSQVQYDMDSLDKKFADENNIDYMEFELQMEEIEREWYALTSQFQRQAQEDGSCVICDTEDCENSNAIVFCDGCNVAVHQECYGIPYIPEDRWFCEPCLSQTQPNCSVCGFKGSAMKLSLQKTWVHVLCAMWLPDVVIESSLYMEPISLENLNLSLCSICNNFGPCTSCMNKNCSVLFHPYCAYRSGFQIKNKILCGKHSTKIKMRKEEQQFDPKEFNPCRPVLPKHVLKKLNLSLEFAMHWSQKRHLNRCLPLCQPRVCADYLRLLEPDLLQVSKMCSLICEREKLKLEQKQNLMNQIELFCPLFLKIQTYIQYIHEIDSKRYFWRPVDTEKVPDYLDVIQTPMDLKKISLKNNMHLYQSFEEFIQDVVLISNNAMTYNSPDTVYYRAAKKLLDFALDPKIPKKTTMEYYWAKIKSAWIPGVLVSRDKRLNIEVLSKQPFVVSCLKQHSKPFHVSDSDDIAKLVQTVDSKESIDTQQNMFLSYYAIMTQLNLDPWPNLDKCVSTLSKRQKKLDLSFLKKKSDKKRRKRE